MEESRRANLHLLDVLADPIWGPSRNPRHSPFSKYIGAEKGLFEWYATPEGAKRGARIGIGMMAWAEAIEAEAVVTGKSMKSCFHLLELILPKIFHGM